MVCSSYSYLQQASLSRCRASMQKRSRPAAAAGQGAHWSISAQLALVTNGVQARDSLVSVTHSSRSMLLISADFPEPAHKPGVLAQVGDKHTGKLRTASKCTRCTDDRDGLAWHGQALLQLVQISQPGPPLAGQLGRGKCSPGLLRHASGARHQVSVPGT